MRREEGDGTSSLLLLAQCPEACSSHGSCINQECQCDPGFFGSFCEQDASKFYPNAWDNLNLAMEVLFGVLIVLSLLQIFILFFYTQGAGRFRKMMLCTVFLAVVMRFMWLLVDPFAFKDRWPIVVERLVFYSADGLIATCSNFVLVFWVLLLRILIPRPVVWVQWPVVLALVIGNLMVWALLIAYAVMCKLLPDAAATLHDIFAVTFGSYILVWAIGLLGIGIKIYVSYIRRLGFWYVNNDSIKKVTILALFTSIILMVTCFTLILSAGFLLSYSSTPLKFLTFQSIFRAEEWTLCFMVIVVVGDFELLVSIYRRCLCRHKFDSSADNNDNIDDREENKRLVDDRNLSDSNRPTK